MESRGFGASLQLKDCIEELLRFTFVSSIDGTLEIDLGLSKYYCSTLLQEDPSNPFPDPTGLSEGVPLYPLYKHLAASLYEAISSEALPRTENKLPVMQETSSLKQKEEEWASLIREKASHLLNMMSFLDVRIEPGAVILINKCLVLQVQDFHHYHSFHEMLEAESLKEVLPGVETAEEGVQVYRKFYSEEREMSNGVLAIGVKKLVSQPSIDLGSMLAELSYAGVQRLLGFVCTVGTVSEALPPPTSSLISSFLLPHNPNILIKIGSPWMSSAT